ncbi:asparagine synthase (glutamine-hydrolyzing), partial [bacterium]|nr:asparagine synthase (glutamine-hydrolyzing) [bacterium]
IYNYLELKTELIENGYRFSTESDTEVLLYSFKEWGVDCVFHLEGMFAFAIWDRKEKILTLMRDRCGIKPLYYSLLGDNLLFASEIKAILTHPHSTTNIDKQALAEYFTFQNFFNSRTLFAGVYLLEPGHYIKFNPESGKLFKERYWDFDFKEPINPRSEESYLEELQDLFTSSVRKHLVSDVPVGCYLSGGMDSGSIASIASQFKKNLKTFCIGFDTQGASALEVNFDETQRAQESADTIKSQHYSRKISAGHLDSALKAVTACLEEPRVGQSYPNYYAAKLASEHTKVVLAGTGGDEIFGGYPWRYYRGVQSKNFNEFVDNYYNFWQRLVPSEVQTKFFSPIDEELKNFEPKSLFRNVFRDYHREIKTPEDMVNASLYFEAKTFLNGLLVIEDKLNMAAGVECRVPFLDTKLVDFTMNLPIKYKLREIDNLARINENETHKASKYFSKTNDGKLILRKVMKNYLPAKVLLAEKQGFSAPDQSWFKNQKVTLLQERFFESDSPIYSYIDKKTVQDLLSSHISGKNNFRLLIWSLLTFDQWIKEFIDT